MEKGPYVEKLSRHECVQLLSSVSVGWIAYCRAEGPGMVPVNFVLNGDEVVIRALYSDKLVAAARDSVMSVGASMLDMAARTGWSVNVTGRTGFVGDPLVNPSLPDVQSWIPWERNVLISVAMEHVSGRRLSR
ncbi:pyridoxamine 5'-phosphate oxidase family protein [Georgenia sp.]